MSTHATEDPAVVLDDRGLSYVRGSSCRVRQLGLEHRAGLPRSELLRLHPEVEPELIGPALAFFRDHARRMEFEALLDRLVSAPP